MECLTVSITNFSLLKIFILPSVISMPQKQRSNLCLGYRLDWVHVLLIEEVLKGLFRHGS